MDINNLILAIDMLQRPQEHPREHVEQAQFFCEKFKEDNKGNLHMFLQLFEQCDQTKQMQH